MTDSTDEYTSSLAAIRAALERRFGVDPRALAGLRVSLALVLLVDLALRARDLTTFYSDAGALPRSALAGLYPAFASVSIHAVSGAAWVQSVLFLVAAAFAVAMLVGYRTRIATIASLVLLVSLHARNPMVLNAGDVLLRRLLFWSVFLPLGAQWAVDAGRGEETRREWVATVASAAILVQVVLVYFTNLAFKLRTDVWLRGDAIRYVYELDEFTVGLAPLVSQFPALLEFAAHGWFVMLCAAPLLLVLTGRARTTLASLYVAGHLGMLLTMDLGIFPLVSLAALLPFLPPSVWGRVEGVAGPLLSRFDSWSFPGPGWLAGVPRGPRARTAQSAFVAVLLAGMLLLNGLALGLVEPPNDAPEAVEDRSWNMFGNPPQSESWYVAHAALESGREVTGHVSSSRWGGPPDGHDRYPRARWRKFQSKVAASDGEQLHVTLAGDVCRRWSASSTESIDSVTLERVREESKLSSADERTSTTIGQYDC